jgi:hypothetical protein
MSEFEALLAQLTAAQEEQTTLAKALPADGGKDDKTIQTAAAEGADGDKTNPEDNEDPETEVDVKGENGKPLAKAMTVDGEEVEVVDAGELIKSLQDLTTRTSETETVLAKGMTAVIGLVKGQSEMIKSLQAQINKISATGTGRKTVLTVLDKPGIGEQPLAKSQGADQQITKAEVLAKANAAYDARKINGLELTSIDVALRNNTQIDAGLLTKCLS